MDSNFFKKYNHFLLLISSEASPITTVKLKESVYSVGRHINNSIKLTSSSVSRNHATLMRKDLVSGESIYIVIDGDLEGKRSQNGTWVNGSKIIHHTLKNGDLITFGSDENKAIYKQEIVGYKHYPYCDIATRRVIDQDNKSDESLSREKLQDTLIISELNLQDNLENLNIQRLASFPELSPNPILEFDFTGKVIYFNPSAKLSFSELLTQQTKDNPLIAGLTLDESKYHGELIIREVEIQNKYYQQYIHYLSQEKVIRSYMFDITERKNSEAKLKYQAFHDSLTGIANRDFFYWQLAKQITEAESLKQKFAVLFIDIDRFKNINDTLSHTVGDTLLEFFAYRLISCIPTDYFMARWGGDEFILVSPLFADFPEVEAIAQSVINSLKQPFLINKYNLYITCSIGIAIYPEDGKNDKNLVKNADIALYRAKQLGRNNYQFYTTKLSKEKRLLFELENNLYHCLEKNELFLTFQPQLNLKTNQILSAEVLLRWRHPILGVISPGKFIPLAEETGLIIPIGEWVLENACVEAKKWVSLGHNPLIIAVNVSAKQFQSKNFASRIKNILRKTRFNPRFLELEITETILMQDHEKTEKIIEELSNIGVKFSLDDFGTGYSSLSYLKKFPFHQVKIDQSFIKDLAFNLQDHALVSAIITLARGYEMRVVAEGVETESQKLLLQTLKCDFIQGWLVSKPLNQTDFIDFLEKNKTEIIKENKG